VPVYGVAAAVVELLEKLGVTEAIVFGCRLAAISASRWFTGSRAGET